MKSSTAVMFLVGGIYFANLLYVHMPSEMTSHFEFYWKTVGFKFCLNLMYIKHIFKGGSTIDCSFIQFGLNRMSDVWRFAAPLAQESKIALEDTTIGDVRVFIYQQTQGGREKRPAFIFLHGGGLTVGSVDIYEIATREIAQSLDDTVLISVDYRLAPKHPFPAAYDDGVFVTKWLLTHADDYGVDPTRVAVGGDSAGGYLTAAIVQAIHDDPTLPEIRLQVLLFPWLQQFDYHTPSYQKNRHFFGMNTWLPNPILGFCSSSYFSGNFNDSLVEHMMANDHTSAAFKNSTIYRRTFDHALIPKEFRDPIYYTPPSPIVFGNDAIWADMKDVLLDHRFSPILREDMSGLPRAYVVTCGFDPLRDDGIFYYHRLHQAGVPVEWVNYEDAFHGVDWFGPAASKTGKRLQQGFINFIKTNI